MYIMENNYFRHKHFPIKSEEIIMINVLYSVCVKCVPNHICFCSKPFFVQSILFFIIFILSYIVVHYDKYVE